MDQQGGDGPVRGVERGQQPDRFSEPSEDLSPEERDRLRRDEAGFFIGRTRQQLGTAEPFTARQPCERCGTTEAYLHARGGQDVVRCSQCGQVLSDASRNGTGRSPRTVETLRRSAEPRQQARHPRR